MGKRLEWGRDWVMEETRTGKRLEWGRDWNGEETGMGKRLEWGRLGWGSGKKACLEKENVIKSPFYECLT